ncbi:hypothetical protein HK102_011915 [Quaeritorhiza haematococci]|nr:hypothetical protein HK102_011915 [Quaeritorhiza haematococci]
MVSVRELDMRVSVISLDGLRWLSWLVSGAKTRDVETEGEHMIRPDTDWMRQSVRDQEGDGDLVVAGLEKKGFGDVEGVEGGVLLPVVYGNKDLGANVYAEVLSRLCCYEGELRAGIKECLDWMPVDD